MFKGRRQLSSVSMNFVQCESGLTHEESGSLSDSTVSIPNVTVSITCPAQLIVVLSGSHSTELCDDRKGTALSEAERQDLELTGGRWIQTFPVFVLFVLAQSEHKMC